MDALFYLENIPQENMAALALLLGLIIGGKSRALPVVIAVFYVLYMALDYDYYGMGPEWNELTAAQETEFNVFCVALGVIIIGFLLLVLRYQYDQTNVCKVAIPGGKKLVFKWSTMIVTACYAIVIAVFWVFPYALQVLTGSYTWQIHAAIMDNMIYLDLGCACLAQVGTPFRDGLKETS